MGCVLELVDKFNYLLGGEDLRSTGFKSRRRKDEKGQGNVVLFNAKQRAHGQAGQALKRVERGRTGDAA